MIVPAVSSAQGSLSNLPNLAGLTRQLDKRPQSQAVLGMAHSTKIKKGRQPCQTRGYQTTIAKTQPAVRKNPLARYHHHQRPTEITRGLQIVPVISFHRPFPR